MDDFSYKPAYLHLVDVITRQLRVFYLIDGAVQGPAEVHVQAVKKALEESLSQAEDLCTDQLGTSILSPQALLDSDLLTEDLETGMLLLQCMYGAYIKDDIAQLFGFDRYVVSKLMELPLRDNLTAEERITHYISALGLQPGQPEEAKAALHSLEMGIGHMHAGSGFFALRERQADSSQPARYYSAFSTPAPLKHAVKINDMEIAIQYLCDNGLEKDYSVRQLSRSELFGALDDEGYAGYGRVGIDA